MVRKFIYSGFWWRMKFEVGEFDKAIFSRRVNYNLRTLGRKKYMVKGVQEFVMNTFIIIKLHFVK